MSPPLLSPLLSIYQHGANGAGEPSRLGLLTKREGEVLGLLVAGMDKSSVAVHLHLSENTVRTHVQNVLTKLGVHSTVAAVSIIRKADVLPNELFNFYLKCPSCQYFLRA